MGSILFYYKLSDLFLCLFKSSVFGALLVLIAVTFGLRVEGGAKEVGNATTQTVITSFVAITVVDYLITLVYL